MQATKADARRMLGGMERRAAGYRWRSDLVWLGALTLPVLLVHFLTGSGYGFHRDELQFLDDGQHLDWGFVAYPPMTAACGRVATALFGASPQVFRLPAALANMVSLVLLGLTARELGGGRAAQTMALLLGLPLALAFASVLQYNTFDLLAWSVLVLGTARVLRTGDAHWWVLAGAGLGLGVLSKYSIAFAAMGLLGGLVVLPSQRHHLRSRWLWAGLLLTLLLASPNLVWLLRHRFITLQMESFIHARDVRNGRADGYYTDQLRFTMLGLPLAVAGLVALLRSERFRLLAFFYLGPFALFALVRGRGYYLLPAYPVLYAAGAVWLEQVLRVRSRVMRVTARGLVAGAVLINCALIAWSYLPVWRAGSPAWVWQMKNNSDMADEIGWPEFVAQVAAVRDGLPAGERTQLAVAANNYGEAGALALYGPAYGLPTPISTVNSFHDRGYGPFAPETVIVTGGVLEREQRSFQSCRVAARVWMPGGVHNEESVDHPEILVCRGLLGTWPAMWAHTRDFG